jgi:D-xylose transport system substrate-binding protein
MSKKMLYSLLMVLLVGAIALSACGPAATPTQAPTAMPAAGTASKIAFLLPETKTARYETQDLPDFKAKLTALGFDVTNNLIYSNANQDASTAGRSCTDQRRQSPGP